MVGLSTAQKEKLSHYLNQYKDRLKEELSEGEWENERKERGELFRKIFSEKHLDKLTEEEFGTAIKQLWASLIWGNKDYLVGKILKDNGIDKVRNAFKELFYSNRPLEERFNLFSESVKGLGPSSTTEIMSFVNPKEYGIWNDKPKNVLPLLGMKELLPERVFKYQIDGKDYVKCNEVLKQIRNEMEAHGFKDLDLLDVDILMWLLFSEVVKKEPKPVVKKDEKEEIEIELQPKAGLDHSDAQGILLELGNLLGYDTYTPDVSKTSKYLGKQLGDIATLKEIPGFTFKDTLEVVSRIDVIWFKNGEYPEHCFEIEHTTGVASGLLRLYQISPLKGIGFFIVAPSDVLSKFEKEITRKPFKEIQKRYIFKSYDELFNFYIEAKKYHELKKMFIG